MQEIITGASALELKTVLIACLGGLRSFLESEKATRPEVKSPVHIGKISLVVEKAKEAK
jgi:hypothetical protein